MPCSADQLVGQIGGRVGDDRGSVRRAHGTVVSRCPGRIADRRSSIRRRWRQDARHRGERASSARTWRARSRRGATSCACSLRRELRPDRRSRARVRAGHRRRQRPPRRAPGDGGRRAGLPRRRHAPRCAPADRDGRFERQRARHPVVLEEALEAGVERVVHTSSPPRSGPAQAAAARPTRRPAVHGRPPRHRLRRTPSTRPRSRPCGSPPAGLPVVIVNPSFVLGPDDPTAHLDGAGAPLPARPDPGLRRRRRSTSSTSATSPTGHLLADERGEVGERYILGGRNFTFDRLFADLGADLRRRAAAAEAAGRASPSRSPRRSSPGRAAGAGPPDEVRSACQWWTYRNTKARRELGFEPRPHEETLEDAVRWQMEQLGDRRRPRRRPAGGAAVAGGRARERPG